MTATWNSGWPHGIAVTLAVILLTAGGGRALAQGAVPRNADTTVAAGRSKSQSAAIFRSAAALQDRELFDLAAAEWASLLNRYPNDPLVAKARHYRGVCLVRLSRFGEAEKEFARVIDEHSELDAALLEQTYANLGFAQYNRARKAKGTDRDAAFDAAIASLGRQLERFPQGKLAAEAQYYRAEACYARDKLDDAIIGYQAVLKDFPTHSLRAPALYGLGAASQELGRADLAGDALDDLLTEFPAHELAADTHFRRGEIYVSVEQFSAAAPHFVAAGQANGYGDSDRARGMLIEIAQAALERGNCESVIEIADRFIETFPRDARSSDAHFLRGECHARAGDFAAAIRDFTRVAEYWPASEQAPSALLRQAELEQRRGDQAAAQVLLGRFLVNYREHELACHAHLLRASSHFEMTHYAQALEDVDAALSATREDTSTRLDALFLRGMCEAKLGQAEAAIKTFHSIMRYDASYARGDRVLYELAGVYESIDEARQAAWAYRRMVNEFEPSPLCAEAHYRIGRWKFAQSDFAGASESFESCLGRATDASLKEKAAHQFAWSKFSGQEHAAARKAFAAQLVEFPGGALAADARIMEAECHYQEQDFSAALDEFVRALDANPSRSQLVETALLHAASAAGGMKEWSRAAALLRRFVRDYPDSVSVMGAHCELGEALYQLKEFEEARRELELVVASNDLSLLARARFMLGEIHFAQKQYDEAVRAFFHVAYGAGDPQQRAVARWQADALFEAARCLEVTERYTSAQKLYRELLERFPESEKAPHARVALQDLKTRMR